MTLVSAVEWAYVDFRVKIVLFSVAANGVNTWRASFNFLRVQNFCRYYQQTKCPSKMKFHSRLETKLKNYEMCAEHVMDGERCVTPVGGRAAAKETSDSRETSLKFPDVMLLVVECGSRGCRNQTLVIATTKRALRNMLKTV